MKIVFMGTPDFAKESLEAIYNAGHEILAVVTKVDKPKGRGMKMICSPVKEFALEKNLKIYQPVKVKNNIEFIEEIRVLKPDVLCVVAYGKILPKEVLDIPKYGAINVHGSLLPQYRGAAPIQWAVLNGDKETGITTMFMDEGMDTGDMILKEKVSIGENETTGELWQRLSTIGAKLLVETLGKVEEAGNSTEKGILEEANNSIEKEEIEEDGNSIEKENVDEKNNSEVIKEKIKKLVQSEKQGQEYTTAPMLNKEMAEIDWNKSTLEIKNLVRGLNPIMVAYTFYDNKKIKIWKADVVSIEEFNENFATLKNVNYDEIENGTIILANRKQGLYIKGKDAVIKIEELQGENSKRMGIKDFLNGNNMEEGKKLRA